MLSNLKGERCPNGAGKDCICSRAIDEQREKDKEAERRRAGSFDRLWANFIWAVGICSIVVWMAVDTYIVHPRPFEFGNLAKSLIVLVVGWLLMRFAASYFATEKADKEVTNRELHEMQCAVRMLVRRESDENREGSDLHKIHTKLDALMREMELMRRGE